VRARLRGARYVNGVAMQHGKVSREMFPDYTIDAITNGVHAGTWTAPAFRALFDCHIPFWREDNLRLRYAMEIPENEIAEAHLQGKRDLIAAVKIRTGLELRPEIFTIGFGRRAATYKRCELLFTDPGWLLRAVMRSTIAINGPYFNTQRMLKQYVLKAYFPQLRPASTPVLEQVLAY
jgi:starch phosphorylase